MDSEKIIVNSGLAILCAGVILLILVFYLAYQLFQDPTLLTFAEVPQTPSGEPDISQFFTNIIYTSISLVALAIMGSVSGRIASKGIELFKSRKG